MDVAEGVEKELVDVDEGVRGLLEEMGSSGMRMSV